MLDPICNAIKLRGSQIWRLGSDWPLRCEFCGRFTRLEDFQPATPVAWFGGRASLGPACHRCDPPSTCHPTTGALCAPDAAVPATPDELRRLAREVLRAD